MLGKEAWDADFKSFLHGPRIVYMGTVVLQHVLAQPLSSGEVKF